MTAGFRAAVSLLTRVPVACSSEPVRGVPWFPLVGALVGVATAAAYAAGLEFLGPLVAASLAVGGQIMVTGALHEDGLADVADATGGASPEDRRRILHDPTHGTFGVLAMVVTTVVRVATLAGLDGGQALAALTAAGALSRGGAVALMATGRPAPGDGLAAGHMRGLTSGPASAGVVSAMVLAAVAIGVWALPSAVLAALVAGAFGRWARRQVGGLSGDVLGAAVVIAEMAVMVLAGAAAAVGHGPGPTWWRG